MRNAQNKGGQYKITAQNFINPVHEQEEGLVGGLEAENEHLLRDADNHDEQAIFMNKAVNLDSNLNELEEILHLQLNQIKQVKGAKMSNANA